jgi:uncharacterized delta-60 repeat protein
VTFARASAWSPQKFDASRTITVVRLSALQDGRVVASRDFDAASREGQLVNLDAGEYEVRVEGLLNDVPLLRGSKKKVVVEAAKVRDAGEFVLAPIAPRPPVLVTAPPAVTNVAEVKISGRKEMFTGLRIGEEVLFQADDETTDFAVSRRLSAGNNDFALVAFNAEQTASEPLLVKVNLDQTPPTARSFGLAGSALAVSTQTVTLQFDADEAAEMMVAADEKFTGGRWIPYETSVTLTLPAQEGATTLFAKFRDKAGNESRALSTTITLDKTAPVLGSLVIAGSAYKNTRTVTLSAVATDGSALEMQVSEFSSFSGAVWVPFAASSTYTVGPGDALRVIYMRVRDAAGWVSGAKNTGFTLDETPPQQPSSVNVSPNPSNGSITVAWIDAGDGGGSGVGHFEVESSGDGIVWSPVDTTTAASYTYAPGAGSYYLRVAAVDKAGNRSAFSQYGGMAEIDTFAPSAGEVYDGLAADIDYSPDSGSVSVNWGGFFDDTAITNYDVAVGTSPGAEDVIAFTPAGVTTTQTLSQTLSEGVMYYTTVRAWDAAGNFVDASSNGFMVDTLPPVAPGAPDASPTVVSTGAVIVSWGATTDSGSGVSGYEVKDAFDSQVYPSGGTSLELNALAEGIHSFSVRAYDAAGNYSTYSVASGTVTVDQTGPSQPGTPGFSANPVSDSVSITWAPSSDAATWVDHYELEESTDFGTTWTLVDSPSTETSVLTPGEGQSLFRVRAVDAAGNAGPYSLDSDSLTVDRTPPMALSMTIKSNGGFVNSSAVEIALAYLDASDLQLSETADFSSGFWEPATTVAYFSLPPEEGLKIVYGRFRDQAGNMSIAVTAAVTIDWTPPMLDSAVLAGGALYVNSVAQPLNIAASGDPVAMSLWGSVEAAGWQPFVPVTSVTLGVADGYVGIDYKGNNDIPYSLARISGGDLLIAGKVQDEGYADRAYLIRTTPDGVTQLFEVVGTGINSASFTDALEQADGRIVAVGVRDDGAGLEWVVRRYTAAGVPDFSFNSTGEVVLGAFAAAGDPRSKVLQQADGKLLVVGTVENNAVPQISVHRLNADGSTDVTAATGAVEGLVASDTVLLADGRLVVAGSGSNGSNSDFAVVAFDTAANLAASAPAMFEISGNDDYATAIAVQSDGTLVVVGSSLNLDLDVTVLRLEPLSLTLTAAPSIHDFGGFEDPYDIAVLGDDKLLIAGDAGSDWLFLRLNADGTADIPWGWGDGHRNIDFGPGELARALVVAPDGKFTAVGTAGSQPFQDWMLASFTAAGDFDAGFGPWGEKSADVYIELRDLAGNTSSAVPASVFFDPSPPYQPSQVWFSGNPVSGPVTVFWSPTSANGAPVDYYELQESSDDIIWATIASTSATSFDHLPPDGLFYYRIVAVDTIGNISYPGLSNSLQVDTSLPVAGTVYDGFSADQAYTYSDNYLEANWSGFDDAESGIAYYELAVGTLPGGDDVYPFTWQGSSNSASAGGLLLVSGNTYYITVRAYNGVGNFVDASSDGIMVDTAPPSVPVNVLATPTLSAGSSVTVSWDTATDAESGVDYYEVYNSATGLSETTTDTSVIVSGLSENSHSFTVRAFDRAGNASSYSSGAPADIDQTPPSQPGQPSFTSNPTSGGVTIMWSPASDFYGIDYYAIEESGDGGITWTQITTTPSDFYEHAPLDGNYLYRVFAVDMAGNLGPYSADSETLLVDMTPPLGGLVQDGSIGDHDYTTDSSNLQGNWTGFDDPESGIVDYLVAVGSTPGFDDIYAFTAVGVTDFAMASGLSLNSGTTYYFTVRAVNGAGLTFDATSDGVMVDYTPPPAPAQPAVFPAMTSTGTVTVSWNPVTDLESGTLGYEVVNQTSFAVFNTAGTSVTETGLGDGTYTPLR